MAVRSGLPARSVKDNLEYFDKSLKKLYGYWLAGVAIGALGLQPSSLSVAGLNINIMRPEAIQGLLYFVVLAQTLLFFTNQAFRLVTGRAWLRLLIYSALTKGRRSLAQYSSREKPALLAAVRMGSWIYRVPMLAFAFLPAVSILCFSWKPLLAAGKALWA